MANWVDGVAEDSISVKDRGLLLADGHFTTAYVADGAVSLWPAHRQRLADGCRLLGFCAPDWSALEREVASACRGYSQAAIRITLTRGDSGRGYEGEWPARPRRLIQIAPFPKRYRAWQQAGIRVACARQRLASGGALAGIKTLARTEQVLLKREVQVRGVEDLLVLDPNGYVVEATAANLFFLIDGVVVTPSLSHSGIAGVMRNHVISLLAEQGRPVLARPMHGNEVASCTAAFMTNCLMGIVPIRQLDQRILKDRSLADTLLDVGVLWR
ncbi:aminodeoxychorismate lyase [Ferrimonas gelatinilytica]|uniref:Aminodeoxychorismate lyase n=1 Tax=Ferrimonas gelatinilytica TaxID=1255257 RepID=A0ABP9RWF8_9GAMM